MVARMRVGSRAGSRAGWEKVIGGWRNGGGDGDGDPGVDVNVWWCVGGGGGRVIVIWKYVCRRVERCEIGYTERALCWWELGRGKRWGGRYGVWEESLFGRGQVKYSLYTVFGCRVGVFSYYVDDNGYMKIQ